LALQRQLNFSREAEREADRIGLQILRDGGFDASGMVGFFGRMQTASRSYSETAPSFLRSHPLTTERIADIGERIRGQVFQQRADSLDFQLIRARVRVLQDGSTQGLHEAAMTFENQLLQKNRIQMVAAQYGLAIIALKQGEFVKAQTLLEKARNAATIVNAASTAALHHSIFASLSIDIKLAARQWAQAVHLIAWYSAPVCRCLDGSGAR
jgi:beta-barrel assembly-enhancing protease